jgi:hypothetical protein
MTLCILLITLPGRCAADAAISLPCRADWRRRRFHRIVVCSFIDPPWVVLKDSTLSNAVGLETDEALALITGSVHFVPRHIQFHHSPTLLVQRSD